MWTQPCVSRSSTNSCANCVVGKEAIAKWWQRPINRTKSICYAVGGMLFVVTWLPFARCIKFLFGHSLIHLRRLRSLSALWTYLSLILMRRLTEPLLLIVCLGVNSVSGYRSMWTDACFLLVFEASISLEAWSICKLLGFLRLGCVIACTQVILSIHFYPWTFTFNFDCHWLSNVLAFALFVESQQVFKRDHYDREVVIWAFWSRKFENLISHLTCHLVNWKGPRRWFFLVELLNRWSHRWPCRVDHVCRGKPIEDAIASEDYEVVDIFVDCVLRDFWDRTNNSRFASELFHFGFDVAKGARNTESPRKNSVRTINHLPGGSSNLAELVCSRHILVCLGLIHLASVVLDSVKLCFFVWPMVLRQIEHAHSIIRA